MGESSHEDDVGPFTVGLGEYGDGWWVFEGSYYYSGPCDTREEAVETACEAYAERLRAKIQVRLGMLKDDRLSTITKLEEALDALNSL